VQGQLNKLMQRLGSTEPHFIRCIKPNTQQLPNVVDQELVLQQLRCCGVLEVVRIARSGYPTRHSHDQFATRWTTFCPCGEGVWENIIMHVAASKSASYASAPSSETCNAGECISRVLRAA
jgi:myosin-5